MRWPAAWKDPAALELLKGTPVNCVLVENLPEIGARAKAAGLAAAQPESVEVVPGLWPGIKFSRRGGDNAAAGPTGVPWGDSNGWKIRMAAALHPGKDIWIDAVPKEPRVSSGAYVTAIADAAAAGGKWIVTLDEKLAEGIAARQAQALETWDKIRGATAFFHAHADWASYTPEAAVGVVSDFTSPLSGELLNLLGRGNQQYRAMPKDKLAKSSFRNLQAVIYPDASGPSAEMRDEVISFVKNGGMLIAGPSWGRPELEPALETHPRYALVQAGSGRIAIARWDLNDPYVLANDAAVLMSHRHELLRFWNGGAISSYYSARYSPGQEAKRAIVQMVFYASRSTDDAAVRIAGRYSKARLITMDDAEPRPIPVEAQNEAVEIHLPGMAHYAAVELFV